MADRRSELRGASHRADGPAIVAAISAGGLTDDVLQLAGGALLLAVAQQVDEAVDLATACVEGLRRRGWVGDELLADQLAAALGSGPAPTPRRLPVDLDELSGILEGDPVHGGGRVDRHTGEVWHQSAVGYARETGEEDDTVTEDADRWLRVDSEGSRGSYRDMETFIGTVTDPACARRLEVALGGRAPFRRFKDTLAAWPDEEDRWFGWSEERCLGRARDWPTPATRRRDGLARAIRTLCLPRGACSSHGQQGPHRLSALEGLRSSLGLESPGYPNEPVVERLGVERDLRSRDQGTVDRRQPGTLGAGSFVQRLEPHCGWPTADLTTCVDTCPQRMLTSPVERVPAGEPVTWEAAAEQLGCGCRNVKESTGLFPIQAAVDRREVHPGLGAATGAVVIIAGLAVGVPSRPRLVKRLCGRQAGV